MGHEINNIVGAQGEAAVAAQLAAAGFHVYAPIFCDPSTDLIAELGDQLIRVQVKTNSGSGHCLRFMVQTRDVASYIGVSDWLALHSAHYGVTAFLRPEEAGVRPTLYFGADKPRQANQRKAADYPIERVIKELTT